jgi:hypothetical protein
MDNMTHDGEIIRQDGSASSAKPRFRPASAGGVPPPVARPTFGLPRGMAADCCWNGSSALQITSPSPVTRHMMIKPSQTKKVRNAAPKPAKAGCGREGRRLRRGPALSSFCILPSSFFFCPAVVLLLGFSPDFML